MFASKLIAPDMPEDLTTDSLIQPNYYTDCGEEYQPNMIANIWELKGSMPQAIKYIKRAGLKPYPDNTAREAEIIDLKKAVSQIEARIEFLKGRK